MAYTGHLCAAHGSSQVQGECYHQPDLQERKLRQVKVTQQVGGTALGTEAQAPLRSAH